MPDPKDEKENLDEAKRIMERLVNTPPKPHVNPALTKASAKKKSDGPSAKKDRPTPKKP